MHNNFYFLKLLAPVLEKKLSGHQLEACFSQEKNEIVLHFIDGTSSFFIRAAFNPALSALSFPSGFARARKNSVDLFRPLIGERVLGVRQYANERSFAIRFTNAFSIVFKMHGSRGNLVLCRSSAPVEIFRNRLKADLSLDADGLDREIDWGYDAFIAHRDNLSQHYFTFGKNVWKYLEQFDFSSLGPTEQWRLIGQVRAQLDEGIIHLTWLEGMPAISLLAFGAVRESFSDPIAALNSFVSVHGQYDQFKKEKDQALSTLRAGIKGGSAYLAKVQEKLKAMEGENRYRKWGDLLMAHLHQVKAGDEEALLPDFDDPSRLVRIPLNRLLTPQKNAEKFYQKGRNQSIELAHLTRAASEKSEALNELTTRLVQVEQAQDLASLRATGVVPGAGASRHTPAVSHPYHAFTYKGFDIFIGKHAAQNDQLTLKFARKDDLWLHARDVAGSHVVIRHQSGKNFPRDVIEKAAQWAAYFSKRKNETLCPVVFTPKKFVRKRKGDPAGAMVVEREQVIMVVPEMPAQQ